MRQGPQCIECGEHSKLVRGDKVYPHRPDLFSRNFYLCACGAYCGTHKGTTKPLGYPCGPETRKARMRAHEAFDKLWKGTQMRRDRAYAWLQEAMGMNRRQCHIGKMSQAEAERVVRLVREREREDA